jgi:capsular exopolysaccharide synthesis family protein
MFICSIGFFAGLMLTGAMVFVIDQTNNTVSMPGYAPALLSVMELGVIPPAGKKDHVRLVGSEGRREIARVEDGARETSVLALERPRTRGGAKAGGPVSVFDDSFRSSINSILFALDEGASHRVIAVSSPGPGEGKTLITANLGSVLAEIGNRVLLIDADVRKPTLHTLLGVENTGGLANLLAGTTPITKESVSALIKRSEAAPVDVLTAGTISTAAFDLFHSKRIAELIDVVRGEYGLILIDTAPLLIVPESRILGRLADWSILVLRAGRTTEPAALAARQQMADDQIPLLGTILNDCKQRRNSNGYWY